MIRTCIYCGRIFEAPRANFCSKTCNNAHLDRGPVMWADGTPATKTDMTQVLKALGYTSEKDFNGKEPING